MWVTTLVNAMSNIKVLLLEVTYSLYFTITTNGFNIAEFILA